jgi:HK97 family phage major capsid protein
MTGSGGRQQFLAKLFPDGVEACPFESLAEFGNLVKAPQMDPRMVQYMAAQREGIGSEGGFAVPEQFALESWGWMYDTGNFWQLADVYPVRSDKLTVSGWDSQSASGGTLFGGWEPAWLEEGGSLSVQTAKLRQIVLNPKKLGLHAKTSNELERDQPRFPQMMTEAMGQAMTYTIEKALLHGTGAGQPKGALATGSKITVSKEVGQAATTIVYENLANMYSRMHSSLRRDAVWMCNSDCIPQLLTVTIDVGTAGSHVQLMKESDGSFSIFGRPVIVTEHCKTLGTEGDVCFANWSGYALALNKEVTIEKSAHVYFTTDEQGYRSIARVDGQPKMSSAFTPENGSTTSWFVTVETRS